MNGSLLCAVTEAAEERKQMRDVYEVGQMVQYVDEKGARHLALVTNWWLAQGQPMVSNEAGSRTEIPEPLCNIVHVTNDESARDPYGRQIERASSVTHRSGSVAPGRFWMHMNEVDTLDPKPV